MRTTKQWVSAVALALIMTFWSGPVQAAPEEIAATAVAKRAADAGIARTQVVMAGMLALLAATLVLRRNSPEPM